jgi:hypothetical protein
VAPNSPSTNYLFDFLYLDRDRIASYAAQIFDSGVLTAVKQVSSSNESSAGKAHGGLGRLAGYEATNSEAINRSIERQFDAAWSTPLNVINELDRLGYIHHQLCDAGFGQLVLFSGRIQLLDMMLVKDLWEPVGRMEVAKMSTATKSQQAAKKQAERQMRDMMDIVQRLPHTLQLKMFTDKEQLWATLKPEHMTINPTDFALKHGPMIPGEWKLICALDARPDQLDLDPARLHTDMEVGILQMLIGLRTIFGRAVSDYGVTPIAIFRAVTPA